VDDLDINLHDYGFRYYDPAIARFTTIDPLAEAVPGWTPFRFGYNNPIRFFDPDGLLEDTYGVDGDGNISKIDDKTYYDSDGNEVDKLVRTDNGEYSTDKDGNIKQDNIDVKKGILKQGVNKKKTPNGVEYTRISTGKYEDEGKALFDFLGSKTDVEWSKVNTTESRKGGTQTDIFSSHEQAEESGGAAFISTLDNYTTLNSHMHSHPPGNKMRDESKYKPSNSDRKFAKDIHRSYPNAKLKIFFQGKYSTYDQYR